jgi:hypothetical protein
VADPKAKVIITAQDQTGPAIRSAERNMKSLLKQGELVGKFFRGGAIVGAIVAFERLAEKAQEAAEAIGDKGTALALKQLNGEIDNLKRKGINLVGQVLGSLYVNFAGTEVQQLTQDIANLRGELDRLNQSNGGSAAGLPGYEAKLEQLRAIEARLANAIALEKSFTSRRGFAVSRGSDWRNGVRTRYSSAFDEDKPKTDKPEKVKEDIVSWQQTMQYALNDLDQQTREDTASFFENLKKDTAGLAGAAKEVQQEFSAITVFAEQAGRNMQTAFADFFFDPFQDGLKGMVAGFADAVRRMAAELFAQQVLTSFFTWGSKLGGGIGKFAGSLLSGITGKATGGPVSGGTPYLVGEAGPELFVPGSSGSIVPNHAMGGASITYNIDARGADAERIMSVMPGLLKQTEDRTIARIRDMNGRGRL